LFSDVKRKSVRLWRRNVSVVKRRSLSEWRLRLARWRRNVYKKLLKLKINARLRRLRELNRTELLYVLFTNMSNWIEKKTLSLYFYIFNALRI